MPIIHPVQPFFVLNADDYFMKLWPQTAIAHFYDFTSKKQMPVDTGAVPDGSVDIIFCCDPQSPQAFIAGTVETGTPRTFREDTEYFGVRLLPGQLDHFEGIAVKELVGTSVDLTEIMGRSDAMEKICLADSFQDRVQGFLQAFPALGDSLSQQEDSAVPLVCEILDRIYATKGSVQIQELEQELLYSRRHLLRVFKEHTGVDIKTFCRIVRFQSILSRLGRGDRRSLAAISADGGYYDQAHFQKEFRQYALMSPGTYVHLLDEDGYDSHITILS